jgi:hypothetical protein
MVRFIVSALLRIQIDRWVLANIYQEDALEVAKIARGE